MTFDEKWPNAVFGDMPADVGHGETQPYLDMMKGRSERPCWMCGHSTTWLNFSFYDAICSKECLNKAWGLFADAMNHMPAPTTGGDW